MISRRHFLHGTAAVNGFLAAGLLFPGWARSAQPLDQAELPALSGTEFDLTIARKSMMIDGLSPVSTYGTELRL